MYFSHVKWFVDPHPDPTQNLKVNELLIIILAISAGLTVLWWLNNFIKQRGWDKSLVPKLWQHVPDIVRLSTAAILLMNFFKDILVAPNFDINHSGSSFLSISLATVGVMLLIGIFSRFTAALLAGLYVYGIFIFGLADMLDHLEYIGLATYIFIAGGGQWTLEKRWLKQKQDDDTQLLAARHLQLWTGLAVVAAALSEKIMAVPLAQDFLATHHWNLLSGFGVDDRTFILIAGTMELLVGLSLILGWAMRVTTLALLGLMATTAVILGLNEVTGHLFAIPLLASVWIVKPSKSKPSTASSA